MNAILLRYKCNSIAFRMQGYYDLGMDQYLDSALAKLKAQHFKITPSRQKILEFLAKSNKALSPYEMKALLKGKKMKADVVTIYRILELLEKLGLVHKVLGFNGYIHCGTEGKNKKTACHHYLLCKVCKKVEEVEGEDLSTLEKKIEKNVGFKIDSHYLEFMGVCRSCSK